MDIFADVGILKAGVDAMRSALGLLRDAQAALPSSAQNAAVTSGLAHAERQIALGEAEIAKALGYKLCHCKFPPPIKLLVGHRMAGNQGIFRDVFECSACGSNDGVGVWQRLDGRQEVGQSTRRSNDEAPGSWMTA